MSFKFNLGDKAYIDCSSERGQIIGRGEFTSSENSYLLRYRAADGRAVESWWAESALSATPGYPHTLKA